MRYCVGRKKEDDGTEGEERERERRSDARCVFSVSRGSVNQNNVL